MKAPPGQRTFRRIERGDCEEEQVRQERKGNGSIALCLSGGGLRATLFHLGVVKALRAHSIDGAPALSRVSEIYSVSGGSILAAHMLVNWQSYIGSDEKFAEMEAQILQFAGRNLRDRVIRRAVLAGPLGAMLGLLSRLPMVRSLTGAKRGLFSRTYWLQKEYKALLGDIRFCDLAHDEEPAAGPVGHFLTTSFKTGKLCSFSGTDFEVEPRDDEVELSGEAQSVGDEDELPDAEVARKPVSTPCGHMKLNFAVAASSAFPPMFPPLELTDDMLANPISDDFLNSISLSDGGVFDNLGIEKFQKNLLRNRRHPSILLISDAGGSFRSSSEKSYSGIFARNIRASDILMHRVGDRAKARIKSMTGVNDIPIRISTQVKDASLDLAVQQRLRLVRTDLDRFSPELAAMLVDHGIRVTHHALAENGNWPAPPAAPAPTLSSTEVARLDVIASRAANRSFWSLPFDYRDWTIIPLLGIFSAFIFAIAYSSIAYVSAQKAEAAANARTKQSLESLIKTARLARQAVKKRRNNEAYRLLTDALQKAQAKLEDDELRDPPSIAIAAAPLPQPGPIAAVAYPQQVYLQFAGDITRAKIVALNQRLRAAGWKVQGPSGERTGSSAGKHEIRYSGENRAAAEALATAINEVRVIPKKVEPNPVEAVQPDVLEVWISI